MSKVDELKNKYSRLTSPTFQKISDGDKTPTKKYLEFMLNLWTNRTQRNGPPVINKMTDIVQRFENCLPYISNKDIYSKDYYDFNNLEDVVYDAENARDEKTFSMNEHCEVIEETESYLLIRPLTIRGSLKYGANTKWCTASKKYPTQFENYTNRGLLLYLISKNKTIGDGVNKVALYSEYHSNPISSSISVYDTYDKLISDVKLIEKGWKMEELFKIVTYFRSRLFELSLTKKSRDFVSNFTTLIGNLNLTDLQKHVKTLESTRNNSYISELDSTIKDFIKNLKLIQDGFINTTNQY